MNPARREFERATTVGTDRVLYVVGAVVGGVLAVGAVAALLIVDFEEPSQAPGSPKPASQSNQADLDKLPVAIVNPARCNRAEPDSAAIAQVTCRYGRDWSVVVRTYPDLPTASSAFPMRNSTAWQDPGSVGEGGQWEFSPDEAQPVLRFNYAVEPIVVDVHGTGNKDEMQQWFNGADKRLE